MEPPLRLEPGELTAEELLDELEAGRRILLNVELLGRPHEVSLRYDGQTYYCDTPTRLHKHSDETDMRECIQRLGYAR